MSQGASTHESPRSPTPYRRAARTKCRRKSDLKFVVDLFLFAAIDTAPAKPVVRVQGTCNWMNEASSCSGRWECRKLETPYSVAGAPLISIRW